MLDRIDLQIHVQSIEYDTMKEPNNSISSQELYHTIDQARAIQTTRFNSPAKYNSIMSSDEVDQYCPQTDDAQELIKLAFNKLHLSMRGYHKIIKVARTIADLAGAAMIDKAHMREAIMYRSLDQALERQRQ